MKNEITSVKVTKDTQRKINILAAVRAESQDEVINKLVSAEIVRVFGRELRPGDARV